MAKIQQSKKWKVQETKKTPDITKVEPKEQNHTKWLLIVLAAAFIALTPILKNGFINYDDDIYVTENPMIQSFNKTGIIALFSDSYMNQYSPLAMLIMAVEFKISNDPSFIKLISVLLHLLTTLLLYKVLQSLFKKFEYIIIPTALFALHPMQIESIAWTAASMKIGTYAVFFMASIFFYLKYLDKSKISYYLLSILFFTFSFLSKEQGLVLAAVLIAVDYFKNRNLTEIKLWVEKIPFFALSLIFGIITLKAASETGESQNIIVSYSLVDRLIIANFSFFSYIGKIFIPVGLSAFYTYPTHEEIDIFYYISLLGLPILSYGFYLSIKKNNRILGFGILFFLINLGLPLLSQLLGARDVMMADRYVYLPCVGIFILLVSGIIYMKERFHVSSSILYGSFIVYALILGTASSARSKVWHDSISLFTDVIDKATQDGKQSRFLSLAYNNRGIALKRQGNYDAALKDYNMGVKINPNDPKSFSNRGNIFFEQQNPQAAIEDYNRALAIDKNNAVALSSRGGAYGMLGKYDSALEDLNQCLKLDPNARNAYLNRSLIYFNKGKYQEALTDINNHLKLNTTDYNSYGQRGLIYLNLKNLNNALNDLTTAINYLPNMGANYFNRSIVYKDLGNKKAAIEDAMKAKQLGMNVSQEYLNSLQ